MSKSEQYFNSLHPMAKYVKGYNLGFLNVFFNRLPAHMTRNQDFRAGWIEGQKDSCSQIVQSKRLLEKCFKLAS